MTSATPDAGFRFAIPDVLRFEAGQGGLTRIVLTHPHATGEMYLHGAHITAWQPQGQSPVLFMSESSRFESGKPIRGGVPICFPWFGPNADDPDAPAHGTARLRSWEVTRTASDDAGVTVEMTTRIAPFHLTYHATFGTALRMALHVRHDGDTPARFEEALHTYFRVGDVRQIEITGLERSEYLDKVAGGRRVREADEPLRFTGETDRVYLASRSECLVRDPVLGRTIRVAKQQSDATVVWNPWIEKSARMPDFGNDEWPGMVCVETCNVAEHAITLPPGASHEMSATITVQ